MDQLKGRVAIITGGARGMGEATSRIFAGAGAKVVITDLLDEEGEALAAEIGDAASYRHHDVADEDSWRDLVADTVGRHGRIDVLVNNAGILMYETLVEMEKAAFEKVLSINLTGTFLGIKTAAPAMIAQGKGSIINISSSDALRGANSLGAYCASKWGIRGLTKVAALELGHRGVRVNSVHPGGINTPMINTTEQTVGEMNLRFLNIPLQRVGLPEEVARVSLFLASDDSSFMCGAELSVDGGAVAGVYYPGLPGSPDA